ncbi:MAG: hypothetical protein M5U34_29235 [Chloroflexi bacterium]|nr:hypothetical protein [Chloroflexota bacterium]
MGKETAVTQPSRYMPNCCIQASQFVLASTWEGERPLLSQTANFQIVASRQASLF